MPKKTLTQKAQLNQVKAVIKKYQHFAITAHVNPDPDALGSALALASLLNRLGKKAAVITDGGMPDTYPFMPKVARVLDAPPKRNKIEVVMTVDVPVLSRTGSMASFIEQCPVSVDIDHHVSNQYFGTVNWVDTHAAATGEMVYRLYKAFGVEPTKREAECIYLALVTDTGFFKYSSTNPSVHRMAAELLEVGVQSHVMSQALHECYQPKDLSFLGKVLGDVQTTLKDQVAWVEVPHALVKKLKPGDEILDELVNYPRSIKTVEVALAFREIEKGVVRINFRSKGRIDVNQIAKQFGGGGHSAASGCRIEGDFRKIQKRVVQAVKQVVKASTGK